MYLTFEEYQNMGGTLDETTFNDLEFEAEALVNWYTFNRLKKDVEYPEELKRLMKYLITTAQIKGNLLLTSVDEESANPIIASQSNDGVSVSYNGLSAKDIMDGIRQESKDAIYRYLDGVMNESGYFLLYRGMYPNE